MAANANVTSSGEVTASAPGKRYTFSVVPKQISSPFFSVVQQGCLDRAKKLGNVECLCNGTKFVDVEGQAQIIRDLVTEKVDGIAVSIAEADSPVTRAAIAYATEAGVPVITFDSDDSGSKRLTYIGTDNYKYGYAMGKVLLQIDPTGGYYGIISTKAPNAVVRETGLRDRLKGSNWVEHPTSPRDCKESGILGIEEMRELAAFPDVKTILPTGGWPMRNVTLWEDFVNDFPNITTVGADSLPHQIDLLDRGYVTGLVGQVPFQMGSQAMDKLLAHKLGESVPAEILGTSLLEIITVPLDLPEANVNTHNIGNLKYLGFSFASAVSMLSIGFAIWTHMNKGRRVVRASQPTFLIMIAVGTAVMGSSMIPMSFDDNNMLLDTENPSVLSCMSPIWLFSLGFTTVFSALYSKTWRVCQVFHNPNAFSRVVVKTRDAMGPLVVLMFANVLTLSLFTALAPLEFVRQPHDGTDDWNRVISTYSTCQSTTDRWGGATPYVVSLFVINFGVLVVANWQAYRARSIQSEFSESKYIGIAMASMLQAFVMAIPILFLVRDFPEVFYVLSVCMVFVICTVILLCIFIPKVLKNAETDASFFIRHPSSLGTSSRDWSLAMTARQPSGLRFTVNSMVTPDEVPEESERLPPIDDCMPPVESAPESYPKNAEP